MMSLPFHLLRPYWLFGCIPLILLGAILLRQAPALHAWRHACDEHLLPHLLEKQGLGGYRRALGLLLASMACLVLSLTGPTGSRLPVPVYQQQHAHVLVLDLSNTMLTQDLPPNRLQRAKFKLHDLFQHENQGQFGLIVYTGESFVVSPLTDDAQTIDALVTSLTPDLMPVGGNRLDSALLEAHELIKQSGASRGNILVLTAEAPSILAINTARTLANAGTATSVLPMLRQKENSALFKQLASAGAGRVFPFSETSTDINRWLSMTQNERGFHAAANDSIPTWRDEGRWLLIPALLLLLPAFRRDWLHRIRP